MDGLSKPQQATLLADLTKRDEAGLTAFIAEATRELATARDAVKMARRSAAFASDRLRIATELLKQRPKKG